MCQEGFPIRKQWMNWPQLVSISYPHCRALCLILKLTLCWSCAQQWIFLWKKKRKPKTKNPNKPTNFWIQTLQCSHSQSPARQELLPFLFPQAQTEQSSVLDWPSSSLSVGDLLQISPCSTAAVTYPFLATKPQMHAHVTSLAVSPGAPRPVPLSGEEGVVHRSLPVPKQNYKQL